MKLTDETILSEMVKVLEGRIKNTIILYDNKSVIDDINNFVNSELSNELKIKALNEFNKLVLFSGTYIGPDPRGNFHVIRKMGLPFLYSKTDKELINNIKLLKEIEKEFERSAMNLEEMTIRALEDREKYKDCLF